MPDNSTDSKAIARNALTKISGMFGRAQKPRWIQDFHILLSHSDPNRRYKPGEVIRGEVHIRPNKLVRLTHITISLYGYVQVFKNFNAPGDGQSKEASHTDPGRLLTTPGIVKLFQPIERTLYGECKLNPNRLLKFEFAIPLPSHRLPTSIDFERGSIAYQLVATITRPTTIGPLIRCEPRKILVNEDIDISPIPAPKPRMVTLEPIEPKSKTKKQRKKNGGSPVYGDGVSAPSDRPESGRSTPSHSRSGSRVSFTQSVNTSVSDCSASIEYRIQQSGNTNSGSSGGSSNGNCRSNRNSKTGVPVAGGKTIYASAEVLRGGFLPGDKIPVKVIVSHNKPIRSLCGVIVTLYRKTHIDTQPVIHKQVVDDSGQTTVKAIMPDVYQKSLTGLGGLSLSNSGTSSTYRMDIAQTTVPLVIDPHSLQATITTSLELPLENVTPTITKVRGESIDFRYYVEVCLDLHGKLESSRYLPRLTAQPLHGFGKPSASNSASLPLSLAAQGAHFVDTQLIRRERPTTIAWQFHVVVGTRDSNRKTAAKRQRDGQQAGNESLSATFGDVDGARSGQLGVTYLGDVQQAWDHSETVELGRALAHGAERYDDVHRAAHEAGREIGHDPTWNRSSSNLSSVPTEPSPPPPPMPSLPTSMGPLDEKARLRQQEEWLLPSAPPMDEVAGPSSAAVVPLVPSAEVVDGPHAGNWDAEIGFRVRDPSYRSPGPGRQEHARPRLQQHHSHSSHFAVPEEEEGYRPHYVHSISYGPGQEGSTVPEWTHGHEHPAPQHQPSYHSDAQGPSSMGPPTASSHGSVARSVGGARTSARPRVDKQELERQRLMSEQSAPQYGDPDEISVSNSRAHAPAPSAPTLGDLAEDHEAQHGAFGEWEGRQEELPRYER